MKVDKLEIEKKGGLYRWYVVMTISGVTITKYSEYYFGSEKDAVEDVVQLIIKKEDVWENSNKFKNTISFSNLISEKLDVPLHIIKRMLVLGKDRNLGDVIETIKECTNYTVRECNDGVSWSIERLGSEYVVVYPSGKYNAELLARRIALIMNSDNYMGGSNESM